MAADKINQFFGVKDNFFIGNYQECIKEAQKIKPSTPEMAIERDGYLYRAYIAQRKFRVVLDEINSSSPAVLQPLKTLADYFANPDRREAILAQLQESISHIDYSNYNFLIVAATIYYHENNLDASLSVLRDTEHLECMSLKLAIYLKMNRVDLAKEVLKSMQTIDEDSTVTQLAQAWLNITTGADKLHEAYYILQEMTDKYSRTNMMLNGQATCFIGQGKYEEAETVLQDSLEKDSNNPVTLINMVVLSHHLGKQPEVANRYLSQLKESHADHPFVKEYAQKTSEFQRLVKQYSVST
ncbi:coatomer subunit epsilon [Megalopta genalis]|uniref:coatomer subunit epsilon n=1 Tax=Megalopta genalis TaxID=115081 RepID=UPI001442FA48|nr:coatomer subunit epsilon [Megalopta genalis]XP_033342915.1 coatomer subunit epsilon [Megalopta genalis]